MVYRLKMLGRGRSRDRVLRGCSGGQRCGEETGECQSPECSGPPSHHVSCRPSTFWAHGLVTASRALLAHVQYWGPSCATLKSQWAPLCTPICNVGTTPTLRAAEVKKDDIWQHL